MSELFSVVEIETHSVCNLRCNYCPNSISERGLLKNCQQMSEDLFFQIIDELSEMGFSGEIHPHFYNEPLLDERLCRFVKYVRNKLPDTEVVVFTNGICLTIEKYQELVMAGVGQFNITRHTPTDPPNVLAVLDYRNTAGSQGVKLVYNSAIIDHGQNIFNRGGLIPITKVVDPMLHCDWPSNFLTINNGGDVLLCCNDYFGSFRVGNLKRDSIRSIWNQPHNKNLRKYLCGDTSKIEICRKCKMGVY
jgi:radical SAM protein with 4Fe4S-binding SPASM domain